MKKVQELLKLVDDAVFLIGQRPTKTKRDGFSSGSLVYNYILTGDEKIGYVRGRIYELFGPEGSGKTTLTLHAAAQVQMKEGVVAFVDVEHALDPEYAQQIGVKLDELMVAQPDSGEQALETVERLITNGANLVVVDSVAALVPRAELEGQIGDSHVGLQARLMSQALRRLAHLVEKKKAILMFTNQLRMKVGIVFGSPETTSGGMALKFYASVRVDVRSHRMDKIKTLAGKKAAVVAEEEGGLVGVKIVKNKLYPPFKSAKLKIVYGQGIDFAYDVLSYASIAGVVSDLTAKTYNYKGKQKNIAGVDNEILKTIYKEAKAAMG